MRVFWVCSLLVLGGVALRGTRNRQPKTSIRALCATCIEDCVPKRETLSRLPSFRSVKASHREQWHFRSDPDSGGTERGRIGDIAMFRFWPVEKVSNVRALSDRRGVVRKRLVGMTSRRFTKPSQSGIGPVSLIPVTGEDSVKPATGFLRSPRREADKA